MTTERLPGWKMASVLALAAAGLLGLTWPAVPASGQQPEQSGSFYRDISPGAYYYDAVNGLWEEGIFNGTDCIEGFCPSQPLKRWEMSVWLMRLLEGLPGPRDYQGSRFVDVFSPEWGGFRAWYATYTEWMAERGITSGCSSAPEKRFCPDQPVTRGQMAVFLSRAFDLPDAEPFGFTDVNPGSSFTPHINKLAAAGITAGCGDKKTLKFCPDKHVTRGQMATFLMRALEQYPEVRKSSVTADNDLSRWTKNNFVDAYGDKLPWLKEVWDYTNSESFEYRYPGPPAAAAADCFRGQSDSGDVLARCNSSYIVMSTPPPSLSDKRAAGFNITLAHELAHVYTRASEAPDDPGPVAIGTLYFFSKYAGQPGCDYSELYAVATADYVEHKLWSTALLGGSSYWARCEQESGLDIGWEELNEAVEVVGQAFEGQMPEWLYTTFGADNPDKVNHKALWEYIQKRGARTVMVGLRHSFGGYCSEEAVWQDYINGEIGSETRLSQPWRNGGCQETLEFLDKIEPSS